MPAFAFNYIQAFAKHEPAAYLNAYDLKAGLKMAKCLKNG